MFSSTTSHSGIPPVADASIHASRRLLFEQRASCYCQPLIPLPGRVCKRLPVLALHVCESERTDRIPRRGLPLHQRPLPYGVRYRRICYVCRVSLLAEWALLPHICIAVLPKCTARSHAALRRTSQKVARKRPLRKTSRTDTSSTRHNFPHSTLVSVRPSTSTTTFFSKCSAACPAAIWRRRSWSRDAGPYLLRANQEASASGGCFQCLFRFVHENSFPLCLLHT
jgi:hypothetical protein